MDRSRVFAIGVGIVAVGLADLPLVSAQTLIGRDALGDWRQDAPGVRRLLRPEDLPAPYETPSARNGAGVIEWSVGTSPVVPEGFIVDLFASNLSGPRTLRVAPNGDLFVAESGADRVMVFRAVNGAPQPTAMSVFADGFDYPYGIAFYPPGPSPNFVYVADNNRIVRFPYQSGDGEARGPGEVVVDRLPTGGHWTRDIAFSLDGKRLFVAVGSRSNVAERMPSLSAEAIADNEARHGVGAAWGGEENRAAVLVFDPDGKNGKLFATGIRNCSGLGIEPVTGEVWCATNERDGLGDDLVPDYVSRIGEGQFYGWPWFYIGANEDPRHAGARPDLTGKVTIPDVLLQSHSAPLGIAFYDRDAFPAEYRGDGFATLHGSWNRSGRTGYKVVRIPLTDGVPTGEYEDFVTGFVVSDDAVWGRPVGIAVAGDGTLLVSEDGNGTIWRIAPRK